MKIIKKIAAIMLSVMMVLGMCSVVGAEETSGTSADYKGTITIDNAIVDQTYTIYQILELESFSDKTTTKPNTGNYAYKAVKEWENFITTGEGQDYLEIKDGYVYWKGNNTDARAAALAKKALDYANKNKKTIHPSQEPVKAKSKNVEFKDLPLGYYLVDSSTGALCSLNTTDTDVTIQEKNGVPSVEKKIVVGSELKDSNTASIGDTVEFKTTITAQPGAQNYVLHDKMDAGLTFTGSVSVTKGEETLVDSKDYSLVTSTPTTAITDGCTFEIKFTKDFCDTLEANDQIIVTYSATLNESAVIAGEGNKNGTWLKYGDSSETEHAETITKTFEIPVFKYTDKSAKGGDAESPLEGAKFILREKDTKKEIGLKSITTPTGKTGAYYRFDKDATAATEVTTNNIGKFTIQGLAPGTYELVEKEAPKGYNTLSGSLEITINGEGKVSYNNETDAAWVKVENKSGSLLPSTGGMGTTLFYIFGAILVIGSGVVLITKKRMK